ncbi:MAG: EamA family transporter [Chloroflexi bacterium]|nr:EamA family transporter [Chloroflexota bacterium]
MKPRETATLVLLATIWGAAFLLIDVVVDEVEPLTVVGGRLLIASMVLVPAARLSGRVMPPRESWAAVVAMAIITNVLPFSLITAAQEHIDSSLAATLIGTMPLFVLLITFAAGTERPSTARVLGLVIGFVGAVVVIGPDLGDITSSNTLSELAVLGASLCYGISAVVARQWAKGPPLSLSAGQLVVAAAISLPIALAVDGPHVGAISGKAIVAWIALGVVCSGVAYILFYDLVQRVTATQASVVAYLIPIVATVLGWAILGERLGPNLFIGLALILVGVMAVNGVLSSAAGIFRGGPPRELEPEP